MAKIFSFGLNILLLWTLVLNEINAEYEVTKYCQLVPVGTKLPSFESCQTYYTCMMYKQVVESKCTGTDVFDKDGQLCVPRTNSNCVLGNPCENLDKTWAPDRKNCRLWHYCTKGEILGSGYCGTAQYFDHNTKSCVNGECPYTMENSKEVNDLCEIMPNEQFFGDFKDCISWNKCKGREISEGTCKDNLVYDTQKRMCLKDNGQMCDRVNGKLETLEGKNCIENGVKLGDVKVCSLHYECQDNKWKLLNCPTNQYYDIESEKCKDRQIAKTTQSCNRCQFTKTTWVNAVDNKCKTYNICKDGQTVATGNCNDDSYFNEAQQYCLTDNWNFAKYKEKNGACQETSCSNVACKIEKCLAETKQSEYQCQLQVYVNEKHLSPDVCRAALCKDSTTTNSYPECSAPVCDADCELQKCVTSGKSDYECKLEACSQKTGVSEDQCKTDLCKDPLKYPECEESSCDAACELEKCLTSGKSDYECQLEACMQKAGISEDQCKTDLCKDPLKYPECEQSSCNAACELEKCLTTGKSEYKCKLEACMQQMETSEDQCKTDLCVDPSTYPECKESTHNSASELQECLTSGKTEYECKVETCIEQGQGMSEKQCKTDLCTSPTSYPDECEIESCLKGHEHTPYECEFKTCKNKGLSDDECKSKICNIPEDFYPECFEIEKCLQNGGKNKYQCEFDACRTNGSSDEDCKMKICNEPGNSYSECLV